MLHPEHIEALGNLGLQPGHPPRWFPHALRSQSECEPASMTAGHPATPSPGPGDNQGQPGRSVSALSPADGNRPWLSELRAPSPPQSTLSAQQTEAMLSDLVEVQTRYRPKLLRSKCPPHFERIAYDKGLGGLESGGCMAGTQYCRITPEGHVAPWPYMSVRAGNIRRQSFREIWEMAPTLLQLRDFAQLEGRADGASSNNCAADAAAALLQHSAITSKKIRHARINPPVKLWRRTKSPGAIKLLCV